MAEIVVLERVYQSANAAMFAALDAVVAFARTELGALSGCLGGSQIVVYGSRTTHSSASTTCCTQCLHRGTCTVGIELITQARRAHEAFVKVLQHYDRMKEINPKWTPKER